MDDGDLSRANLKAEIEELRNLQQILNDNVSMVRRRLSAAKNKLLSASAEKRDVSDHAIVRYLERAKGVDVAAIRNEITELADKAVPFKNCDGLWEASSGVVIITNDDGLVVTILTQEQAQKYIGRRLTNGDRAAYPES